MKKLMTVVGILALLVLLSGCVVDSEQKRLELEAQITSLNAQKAQYDAEAAGAKAKADIAIAQAQTASEQARAAAEVQIAQLQTQADQARANGELIQQQLLTINEELSTLQQQANAASANVKLYFILGGGVVILFCCMVLGASIVAYGVIHDAHRREPSQPTTIIVLPALRRPQPGEDGMPLYLGNQRIIEPQERRRS